jgi:hypothetical protein
MKEELIKKKLLAEFREWFCEGYCQFYGLDDYCICCPVKDENCWLRGVKKPAGEKRERKPIRFCDTCNNFIPDERDICDEDNLLEDVSKPPYSELCALKHSLRFKMPNDYNDDNYGFYRKECKDYKEIN